MSYTWNNTAPALANQVNNDVPDIAENFQYLKGLLNNHYKRWESDGVSVSANNRYYIDPSEGDQGATGSSNTVHYHTTNIGTSTNAALYFVHDVASGATTTYTWTSTGTSTIGSNFHCLIEQGVRWAIATNCTVLVKGPVNCVDLGNLATGDGTLTFSPTVQDVHPQTTLLMRGFRQGMKLSWKDADEIYIDAGSVHVNNGKDHVFYTASQLTKQLTSLSVSTWYAVYVDPPDSGIVLTSSDIEYSDTMPTYDQAKGGWYHPTTTDLRCIGFVDTDSSGNINNFTYQRGRFLWKDQTPKWAEVTPSTTWTTVTAGIPIGGIVALANAFQTYADAYNTAYYREKGSSGDGFRISQFDSSITISIYHAELPVDSSKQGEVKCDGACTNKVWLYGLGFILPDGI